MKSLAIQIVLLTAAAGWTHAAPAQDGRAQQAALYLGEAVTALTQARQALLDPASAGPMGVSRGLKAAHDALLQACYPFNDLYPELHGSGDPLTVNLWSYELQLRDLPTRVEFFEERWTKFRKGDFDTELAIVERALGYAREALDRLATRSPKTASVDELRAMKKGCEPDLFKIGGVNGVGLGRLDAGNGPLGIVVRLDGSRPEDSVRSDVLKGCPGLANVPWELKTIGEVTPQ